MLQNIGIRVSRKKRPLSNERGRYPPIYLLRYPIPLLKSPVFSYL